MILRPKGKSKNVPTIHINGPNILDVDNAKILGAMIDDKLRWLEHIMYSQTNY